VVNIPNPKDYKNEKDFMAACVPIVSHEHSDWDNDKCVAACYSMWRNRNKNKENNKHDGKIYLTLGANLNCHYDSELSDEMGNMNTVLSIDTSTILVGDGTYNGIFFPKEELEKAYKGWDKVPINIDHNDETIEDIVGFVDNPQYINDKIVVKPVFDSDTSKYNVAMGYIKSRMKAGRIPNVSVGVWVDRVEEKMEDDETRMTARNLEADHLALVVKGACSPEAGCGIGMGLKKEEPIEEIILEPSNNIIISFEDYVDDKKSYEDLEIEILKERIKKEKLR